MPEGVLEKQPDRVAVWIFQEVEAVSGSEAISINSKDWKLYITQSTYSFSTTLHFWLNPPNAEMTLGFEANEAEVKVLTSLASVTGSTGAAWLLVGGSDTLVLGLFDV
jgi:hypothetical protein